MNVVPLSRYAKPTWEEALEDFLNLKGAEGRAPRTLTDYRKHVTRFFTRFPDAYENEKEARSALLKHLAQAKTPSTHNLRLEYLRGFSRWLWEEGIFTNDVTYKLKKQKNPGKFIPVDKDSLLSLLGLPDLATYTGYRDYCLILFTLDTATRPGEALKLIPSDFNLRSLEVHIPSLVAKTRISRTIPISGETTKSIRKLLSVRHPEWKDNVPLFASSDGLCMLETSWGKRMRGYSKKLGVKITPYMLRHSSATLFLRNGGSSFALQRMMGHTSMEMTERYVHLVQDDVKQEHKKHSALSGMFEEIHRKRRL